MNSLAPLYTQNTAAAVPKKMFRTIPQAPERILDAPDLLDDYYLNLVDWSSTNVVRQHCRTLRGCPMQLPLPANCSVCSLES